MKYKTKVPDNEQTTLLDQAYTLIGKAAATIKMADKYLHKKFLTKTSKMRTKRKYLRKCLALFKSLPIIAQINT